MDWSSLPTSPWSCLSSGPIQSIWEELAGGGGGGSGLIDSPAFLSCTLMGKRTVRPASTSSDAVCEDRSPPATLPQETPRPPAWPPTTQPTTAWARVPQEPFTPPTEPPRGKGGLASPQQGPPQPKTEGAWGERDGVGCPLPSWRPPRGGLLALVDPTPAGPASPQAPSWLLSWAWACLPPWWPRWPCSCTTEPGGCPPVSTPCGPSPDGLPKG